MVIMSAPLSYVILNLEKLMTARMNPEEKFRNQKLRNTALFLRRAKEIHGDRFDYSEFNYVNAKTKSTIICRVHGPFLENPDKHLNSIHACPACWSISRKEQAQAREHYPQPEKRISAEEYLRRLALPDHITVDMSDYQGLTKGTVTITCEKHGPSTQIPHFLLRVQYRCPRCGYEQAQRSKTKSFDNFLNAVKEVHGSRYEIPYPEEYENRKSWLTVVCKLHGAFSKKGQKLLSGQGCFRCRINELVADGTLSGGYNSRFFVEHPELKDADAIVYYVKLDDLYKIGITRNKIKRRLSSLKKTSGRTLTVLDTYECTLLEAYTLEQIILHDFRLVRTYETWSTELFTVDVMGEATLEEYAALVLCDSVTSLI